ncbi:MFS transporter [Planctomicrobium piriforme]|uniref:MFS transporter, NNP family, nitrate/nitrite transporter n=1 Tax=Planctomicrobium piriforme TaxID=1576369 RepID=A0A1I3QHL1_9PLAN|nr:MFS transporter [Planctomicrobium piriforme]SFJ32781.1 MFS transporter, NNP family, nitrate/nitrite transporter [Planctomicrobium piriforme]
MHASGPATRIRLFDFNSPQMRAFHMSWFAFFLCFFAWFGIAPLMGIVRAELHLTKDQVGWCIIGSVAITVFARLFIGWLCDRIGPRLAYTGLLLIGSIPVMGIAFAHDYTTFLLFRIAIGVIGASFVITQYHTSLMFAPNCVGTANATTAGWGNLGGGVTQMVMPLLFGFLVTTMGFSSAISWRLSMVLAGIVCALTGIAYYFLVQDTPQGNFHELRRTGQMPGRKQVKGSFLAACRDYRVWALFVLYGCCFGMELTLDNIAALYFVDYFDELKNMDSVAALRTAGFVAGLFGAMNLFARALGGLIGDRFGARWGLHGRARWLFVAVFCEGLALMLFSQARTLAVAVPTMLLLGLFVKMSNGATYSVVPFINRKALGSVSGIVGAGGNVGAVLAGFLFKSSAINWPTALLVLGVCITFASFSAFFVRFSPAMEAEALEATNAAVAERHSIQELAPAS